IVKIPSKEAVGKFLPPYDLAERRLHPDNPISIAPQVNEDWVMELRRQNWEAARRARSVIKEAYQEFNAIFGERYASPYFTEFMTDDAEAVLIGLGQVAAAGRTAARRLREKGQKVGYINLRWFRPFPTLELRESLQRFKVVGVIDRDFAHGSADDGGILLHEVRSCLYPAKNRPVVTNFITGLGGRDVSINDCVKMFDLTQQAAGHLSRDGQVTWIGVRESPGKEPPMAAPEAIAYEKIKGVHNIHLEEFYTSGHRTCQACESTTVMRGFIKAAGPRTVVTGSTGCMYVANTSYMTTPWIVPWMHTQLGAGGSSAVGMAAGLRALKRKG